MLPSYGTTQPLICSGAAPGRYGRRAQQVSTRHRLQVGITGWAQVSGLRGDTSIARRVEYDLYYLNHWSLGFDLRILILTAAGLARNLFGFGRTEPKVRDARIV